ncbi:MAG: hypothetical protein DMF65_06750 [Acidobacteria bacterium]|nr:MAG: hypothetical protein DMF65_06750 [Acidobacteriota bacterium]
MSAARSHASCVSRPTSRATARDSKSWAARSSTKRRRPRAPPPPSCRPSRASCSTTIRRRRPPALRTRPPPSSSGTLSPSLRDSTPTPAGPSDAPAPEFEWNSVAEPPRADADASFADLNDLTDAGVAAQGHSVQQQSHEQPPPSYQEFDFGVHAPDAVAHEDASRAGGEGVERMLRQEIESVDFYIEQGYADIARDTLDMLERQYGPHAEIEARRARLAATAPAVESEGAVGASVEEAAHVVFTETPQAVSDNSRPANDYQPTNNSQPAATESSQARAATSGIDPGLAAIFDEFREAVEDTGDEGAGADFDTHYQMGLAYREMGLHDQAVEEFQTAATMTTPGDGTPRYLQCCNLLGHCFMEKQMPRPAAMWFKKGLAAPGHTEDEYQAMRYDLATAYERMGDTERAIEVLSEVYAINVSYREVAGRLRELQKASK